jgi:DNA repair exonuclease SbcCD ATPase subunit
MILFETVRWKNILSTGNTFTEIKLNKSPNTLIIGHNGAGKSTILDALCFGLFNKPFRKINKPNLLNSINQQQGVVEVEFTIGRKKYKVIRGIKPNTFEVFCNGALLPQDSKNTDYQEVLEKSILKLNFKSFTQVVILGSASFIPFMQLKPSDRREIIEDLLDIQIFSSMNNLVKDKLSFIKETNGKIKYDLELTAEKINLQKQNIEDHKKQSDAEIEKKNLEIQDNQNQLTKLEQNIVLVQKHIDSLQSKINDKLPLENKNKKLIQLESKIESNLKKIEKEIKFYEENDSCPTCKQGIEEHFRESQIQERKTKEDTQREGIKEIESQINNVNNRLVEINGVIKHINEHNNEITKYNSTMTAINKYVRKLQQEIQELSNRKNNLEEENTKLKELKEHLKGLMKEQESISIEKNYYDYAANLLKDTGIKTRIIKQYLPIMNKLINKYLKAMDFFVNFELNENFEETIKSRHRDEFTYANFSEGEKMRIDLALLFTWRQIAKLKNSTNTNLLILDEVMDSSLDLAGTEEFMKLIQGMTNDTNLFVISHKGDQLFDKFRSVIKFKKINNFSQVEK